MTFKSIFLKLELPLFYFKIHSYTDGTRGLNLINDEDEKHKFVTNQYERNSELMITVTFLGHAANTVYSKPYLAI